MYNINGLHIIFCSSNIIFIKVIFKSVVLMVNLQNEGRTTYELFTTTILSRHLYRSGKL